MQFMVYEELASVVYKRTEVTVNYELVISQRR